MQVSYMIQGGSAFQMTSMVQMVEIPSVIFNALIQLSVHSTFIWMEWFEWLEWFGRLKCLWWLA